MPQQILVEDDTQPVLSDTLDTAKDPTGGSVTLVVQQGGSTNLLVNDTGTITDTTTGATVVEYQFTAAQTANTGTHKYEWIIDYSGGDTESFPKDGFFEVEFDAQLNRGGTVVTPSTTGRAGPIDVLLLNEQGSTPSSPAADDWGLYVDSSDVFRRLDESGDPSALAAINVTEVTADYTAAPGDVVLADASGGDFNVTAPSPALDVDFTTKLVSASGNVTLKTPGSGTIDGAQNLTISNQWTSRTLVANATDYFNL